MDEYDKRKLGPRGDLGLIIIELVVIAAISLPTLALLAWDNPSGQHLRWLIYSASTTAILLSELAVFIVRRRSVAAVFQSVLLTANLIFIGILDSKIPLHGDFHGY